MLRTARLAYRTLAGLFVAGTVAQFFLAGLGVFGAASFGAHATLGTILGIVSLILLLLAGVLVFAGGLEKRTAGVAALLVVLMVVQYSLVELFLGGGPGPRGAASGERPLGAGRGLLPRLRASYVPVRRAEPSLTPRLQGRIPLSLRQAERDLPDGYAT